MAKRSQTGISLEERKTALRLRDVLAIAVLGLLTMAGITWFVTNFEFLSWDFRNNLWAPSQLLVTGRSPYDLSPFNFERARAVWFPFVLGVLFPLGWLSQQIATNVWLVFNAIVLILIVLATRDPQRPRPWLFGVLIMAVFLFPPTISHLTLGQITILTAAIFLFVVHFFDRLPCLVSAGFLVVTLAKPQLGVLALPGLLLDIWRQHGARPAISFLFQLLAIGAALTVPLFLAEPSWPGDFISSLRENPHWLHPSLLTILQLQLGQGATLLWMPVLLAIFVANLHLWRMLPRRQAILWSLALTPLITPYVWSWDFLLLLPLFCTIAFHAQSRKALFLLLLGYALCWIAAFWLAFSADEVSNHLYWWIPWLLLAVVCSAVWLDGKRLLNVAADRA